MNRADQRKFHFIYKTTCLTSGKHYFGMHSTDDMDDGYLGSGRLLQYSIKKYGKGTHVRETIELLPDRKSLKKREAEIIDHDRLNDPLCLNLSLGGHEPGTMLGRKHSLETKKKLSIAITRLAAEGRGMFSSTAKAKNAEKSRTRKYGPRTDEVKRKLSLSKKRFYENGGIHPRQGKHLSEETKQKLREAWVKRKLKSSF